MTNKQIVATTLTQEQMIVFKQKAEEAGFGKRDTSNFLRYLIGFESVKKRGRNKLSKESTQGDYT